LDIYQWDAGLAVTGQKKVLPSLSQQELVAGPVTY
jgi:hypothetical protein